MAGSGTSGGHAWSAPEMRGPGADFRVTARTMQGMARVRSGQAPAWPLSSGRSVRRGSGVKRDFACTFTRRFSPVLVARRSQSRLMLEGRARTLSGPSPDLSQATTLPPSGRSEDLQIRRYPAPAHYSIVRREPAPMLLEPRLVARRPVHPIRARAPVWAVDRRASAAPQRRCRRPAGPR